ncbi:MAG: YitT family protein [Oscillospiraceae bacterium]|nr:YitT family protein [Oscillospiraceae bacterium]
MAKKFNFKFTLKDVFLVVLGIFVMSIGTAMSYIANIGTGSIGTLVDGLHNLLSISYGTADILICIVLMAPMLLMAPDLLGIGTLISTFGIGMFIDLCKALLELIPFGNGWAVRLVLCVVGMIISSLGASIYVSTGAGISSFDALMIITYRITGLSYSHASIVANYTVLLLGWLIGGTVGLGTLVTILVGGYVSGFFMNRTWKYIGKPSPLQREESKPEETEA